MKDANRIKRTVLTKDKMKIAVQKALDAIGCEMEIAYASKNNIANLK